MQWWWHSSWTEVAIVLSWDVGCVCVCCVCVCVCVSVRKHVSGGRRSIGRPSVQCVLILLWWEWKQGQHTHTHSWIGGCITWIITPCAPPGGCSGFTEMGKVCSYDIIIMGQWYPLTLWLCSKLHTNVLFYATWAYLTYSTAPKCTAALQTVQWWSAKRTV